MAFAAAALSGAAAEDAAIPNLVGTWVGENLTVSDKKGYRDWGEKTVVITEQKDRRFRGHFTYPAGTKNFLRRHLPRQRLLHLGRVGFQGLQPWSHSRARSHRRLLRGVR